MNNINKRTHTPTAISAVNSTTMQPPAAAIWMVKKSVCSADRESELIKYKTAFDAELTRTGCLKEARAWAYRYAWDVLKNRHKPAIELTMYVLTVLGFLLALLAIALA